MNVFLQILQFTILIIILVLCILILIKNLQNTQSEEYIMEECSNYQNSDECNNAKSPSGEKCTYREDNCVGICSTYGSQDCDNAKDANGERLKCASTGDKCVYRGGIKSCLEVYIKIKFFNFIW